MVKVLHLTLVCSHARVLMVSFLSAPHRYGEQVKAFFEYVGKVKDMQKAERAGAGAANRASSPIIIPSSSSLSPKIHLPNGV